MSNIININVNKTDLGLNNVDNTSDLNKPISTATQTALNGKENVSNKSTNTSLGTSDTLYPTQKAVKTYVDTAMSTPVIPTLDEVATAGNTTDTPLIIQNAVFTGTLASGQFQVQRQATGQGTSINCDGWVSINTTGYNKVEFKGTNLHADIVLEAPNKTAGTYTLATTDIIGAANGLAELDGTGKVPSSQLPSFVDDVVDYANLAAFPVTGESGKIYVALDTNLTYRWSGSVYVEISPSLALGETSASAYRGDRGKIAYDHSQLTSGNPHNVTKSDIGLSNCDNTSDANKPISSATQTALDNKSDKNITLDRKTASYTLVANDNGKMIEMNVASANTLTIDASIFSAGNQILISQYGAGQTTITAGAGVTLRSSGGKLKTSAQYSLVTIIAISSTEFYVAGDLTA